MIPRFARMHVTRHRRHADFWQQKPYLMTGLTVVWTGFAVWTRREAAKKLLGRIASLEADVERLKRAMHLSEQRTARERALAEAEKLARAHQSYYKIHQSQPSRPID